MKSIKLFPSLLFIFTVSIVTYAGSETLPPNTQAAVNTEFKMGEDYELLKNPPAVRQDNRSIEIIEFFSFGCPACYYLEPVLEKWIATHQTTTINFHRIPVIFEPKWRMYAKAFYVAQAMDLHEKITLDIFQSIHEKHEELQSPEDLKKFFINHNVSAEEFDSAFNFSPRVDAQVNHSMQLMQQYKITEIPTLIIANKYKTTGRMAHTRERLLAILDFLIAKEQQASKKT